MVYVDVTADNRTFLDVTVLTVDNRTYVDETFLFKISR